MTLLRVNAKPDDTKWSRYACSMNDAWWLTVLVGPILTGIAAGGVVEFSSRRADHRASDAQIEAEWAGVRAKLHSMMGHSYRRSYTSSADLGAADRDMYKLLRDLPLVYWYARLLRPDLYAALHYRDSVERTLKAGEALDARLNAVMASQNIADRQSVAAVARTAFMFSSPGDRSSPPKNLAPRFVANVLEADSGIPAKKLLAAVPDATRVVNDANLWSAIHDYLTADEALRTGSPIQQALEKAYAEDLTPIGRRERRRRQKSAPRYVPPATSLYH